MEPSTDSKEKLFLIHFIYKDLIDFEDHYGIVFAKSANEALEKLNAEEKIIPHAVYDLDFDKIRKDGFWVI